MNSDGSCCAPNAGHAHGVEAGRAEGIDASIAATGDGKALARAVGGALHASKLPPVQLVALLLELARGRVLDLPRR